MTAINGSVMMMTTTPMVAAPPMVATVPISVMVPVRADAETQSEADQRRRRIDRRRWRGIDNTASARQITAACKSLDPTPIDAAPGPGATNHINKAAGGHRGDDAVSRSRAAAQI